MNYFYLKRTFDSPLLFFVLLPLVFILANTWYRTEASLRAPHIEGYDWAQHPNTLLIAFPSEDCGCGKSPLDRVKIGLDQGFDVMVIAPASTSNLQSLKRHKFPASRFTMLTNMSKAMIQRFCSGKEPVEIPVRNGRLAFLPNTTQ